MAAETTFAVPTDRFPLGTAFVQPPNVTVKLERLVPHTGRGDPWVRRTVVDVESASTGSEDPVVVEAASAESPLMCAGPIRNPLIS